MGKSKILLIDMYGVIIKESKGYFVPYTLQKFETSEHGKSKELSGMNSVSQRHRREN